MPSVKPKARTDLTIVELDGEAVIYDEETAELHHLNPTATIAFGLCDGTSTIKEMSVDVSETFGVPVEEVETQIRILIRHLRRAKLLIPSGRASNDGRYVADRTEGTRGAS